MLQVLTPADRRFLSSARTATLATITSDGRPRLVPICFVVVDDIVWTPLDEKPKAVDDVRSLARVRDILARPSVTLLVVRWSEDWSELAWLRIQGRAEVVDGEPMVIAELRRKYPQYADHGLEGRPMIAITIESTARWSAR